MPHGASGTQLPSTRTGSHVLAVIGRHPLLAYFVVAYAISWSLWLPRVATTQGWWGYDVPPWWHYAGASGPILAALLVSALTEGRAGVGSLLEQYAPSRVRWRWLAFAVLSPLALLALALVVARAVDGAWPSLDSLSHADDLPAMILPLTLLVHLLTYGVGEETGWRGFALPRLQQRHTAIRATHRLALGWGLWHLPTFFENESFMAMGAVQIIGWSAGLWVGAIFLTWLYNSSRGSLIIIVLWHGLFNQFAASEAPSIVPAVITMGVVVMTVVALRIAGTDELTGLSPHGDRRVTHDLRDPASTTTGGAEQRALNN